MRNIRFRSPRGHADGQCPNQVSFVPLCSLTSGLPLPITAMYVFFAFAPFPVMGPDTGELSVDFLTHAKIHLGSPYLPSVDALPDVEDRFGSG